MKTKRRINRAPKSIRPELTAWVKTYHMMVRFVQENRIECGRGAIVFQTGVDHELRFVGIDEFVQVGQQAYSIHPENHEDIIRALQEYDWKREFCLLVLSRDATYLRLQMGALCMGGWRAVKGVKEIKIEYAEHQKRIARADFRLRKHMRGGRL